MSWVYEGIKFKTFKVFVAYKKYRENPRRNDYAKYIRVYVFGDKNKPVDIEENYYNRIEKEFKEKNIKIYLTPTN